MPTTRCPAAPTYPADPTPPSLKPWPTASRSPPHWPAQRSHGRRPGGPARARPDGHAGPRAAGGRRIDGRRKPIHGVLELLPDPPLPLLHPPPDRLRQSPPTHQPSLGHRLRHPTSRGPPRPGLRLPRMRRHLGLRRGEGTGWRHTHVGDPAEGERGGVRGVLTAGRGWDWLLSSRAWLARENFVRQHLSWASRATGPADSAGTSVCRSAPHGAAASVCASSTGTVHSPPTRRADAISCANLLRNSGSEASPVAHGTLLHPARDLRSRSLLFDRGRRTAAARSSSGKVGTGCPF